MNAALGVSFRIHNKKLPIVGDCCFCNCPPQAAMINNLPPPDPPPPKRNNQIPTFVNHIF